MFDQTQKPSCFLVHIFFFVSVSALIQNVEPPGLQASSCLASRLWPFNPWLFYRALCFQDWLKFSPFLTWANALIEAIQADVGAPGAPGPGPPMFLEPMCGSGALPLILKVNGLKLQSRCDQDAIKMRSRYNHDAITMQSR